MIEKGALWERGSGLIQAGSLPLITDFLEGNVPGTADGIHQPNVSVEKSPCHKLLDNAPRRVQNNAIIRILRLSLKNYSQHSYSSEVANVVVNFSGYKPNRLAIRFFVPDKVLFLLKVFDFFNALA